MNGASPGSGVKLAVEIVETGADLGIQVVGHSFLR
jgi:hypothetical protein